MWHQQKLQNENKGDVTYLQTPLLKLDEESSTRQRDVTSMLINVKSLYM